MEKDSDFLDVIRIGDAAFLVANKHYGACCLGALEIVPPSVSGVEDAVLAGPRLDDGWPTVRLKLALDELYGPNYLLRDKIESVLRTLGPGDAVPVEVGMAGCKLKLFSSNRTTFVPPNGTALSSSRRAISSSSSGVGAAVWTASSAPVRFCAHFSN